MSCIDVDTLLQNKDFVTLCLLQKKWKERKLNYVHDSVSSDEYTAHGEEMYRQFQEKDAYDSDNKTEIYDTDIYVKQSKRNIVEDRINFHSDDDIAQVILHETDENKEFTPDSFEIDRKYTKDKQNKSLNTKVTLIEDVDNLDEGSRDNSKRNTQTELEHEVEHDFDVDQLKVTTQIEQTPCHNETHTDEREIISKTDAVPLNVPADGSCLYHALSCYVEKNGQCITIINPHHTTSVSSSSTVLNVQAFKQNTSIFLRNWINQFIYDYTDLLSQIFEVGILDESSTYTELNKIKTKIKKEALEALVPGSMSWGGSLQIHVFSLLTNTNVCVWVDQCNNLYEKIVDTQRSLRQLKEDKKSYVLQKVETACRASGVHVQNNNTIEIHIYLNNLHYDALHLLS